VFAERDHERVAHHFGAAPLADLFPLLEGSEFDELVADIEANGLLEPVVTFEGKILDGRNRYRACLTAEVEPSLSSFTGSDPAAFVISKNLRRRHLTAEQKRELIAKLVKAQPEKSDRQIAKQIGAHHTTVGNVRRAEEGRGEISHVETRTDTKGRKQPARKSPPHGAVRQGNRPTRAASRPRIPKARDDVGPHSMSEWERLLTRYEESKNEICRLQRENTALRSEIAKLRAELLATPAFLQRQPA
jgi:ParB/Sulfiredoxin domain